MAGVAKERIKDWMRRRFPPVAKFVSVFECADVTQLLGEDEPRDGIAAREGMLFASRDQVAPAPRKELVILTSVLASYSAERIITMLEKSVAPNLDSRPHFRLLLGENLRIFSWGQSSTGFGQGESDPCDPPQPPAE
jgi:hypothetical protein